MFGSCITGKHEDFCKGRVQRWQHGTTGVGKKKKNIIVYLDEWFECDCRCHNPNVKKKVKKKTISRTGRKKK